MEQLAARRAHNPKVTGSSPVPATSRNLTNTRRGVEQLAARRAHNPKVIGSSPIPATSYAFAANTRRGVEQLAARRAHNPKVTGSSPVPATKILKKPLFNRIAAFLYVVSI